MGAVLNARGGDSGQSCTICLGEYEDDEGAGEGMTGAAGGGPTVLRVLPCGHRFHCDCVDRWLVEQSGNCPLCSQAV